MGEQSINRPNVIMLLTNGFAPDLRVYKQAVYLTKKGFFVTVFCWDRTGQLPDVERVDGIVVKRCNISSAYGTGLRQLPAYFRFLLACIRYMNDINCDYLHCTDLDTMIISLFCHNKKTRQLVFDMREFYDSASLAKFSFLAKRITAYMCSYADYVLYVNELQLIHLNLHKRDKYIFLPNYPETNKFKNIRKTKSEKIRIAYIGMVRHFDILKALLDECSIIQDKVDVFIHGAGIATERLSQYAKKIGYGYVTGMFDHMNVGALYENCDIVTCIYHENDANERRAYPTKLFESIASCRPILTQEGTNAGFFVREHGIGFCVDWKQEGSIMSVLKNIVDCPASLDSMCEQMEKLRTQYTWENVVSHMDYAFK